MAGNYSQCLQLAQQFCWDESHGYELGGMGFPTFDCSGFIGRCLYESGFNYPTSHIGTAFMSSYLITAGFIELPYNRYTFVPQNGDIFVMNEGSNGHTFFYCENIRAYTDPSGRSNNIGMVAQAKVEASSSRTHGYSYADGDAGTIPGDINNPSGSSDYPRNTTGAHWEVWCHAYYSLVDHSTYTHDSSVKVYRLRGGFIDDGVAGALLLFKNFLGKKKIGKYYR